MARAPSLNALEFAVEWLRSYENAPDDDNGALGEEVAAWLDERIKARVWAEEISKFAKANNSTPAKVRAALKRGQLARKAS